MPSNLFISRDSPTNNEWRDPIYYHYKSTSKIWLFMVGSSAAGIIPPLSRYFISNIFQDLIVPIFIDCKIHSVVTSSSIEDIDLYNEYCRITCQKSKISPPLFFIESKLDDLLFLKQFQSIIDLITLKDKVFISFSAHSEQNVSLALKIGELCKKQTKTSHISYGIFLPYLTFYTNDNIGEFLTELKNRKSLQYLNQNLEIINRATSSSNKFFIGLSEKAIVNEADIQRNPLNIVQLIMAFAVTYLGREDVESLSYNIPYKNDFLTPTDVVQDVEFRNLIIFHDFLHLAFSFLNNRNFLPPRLQEDKELRRALTSYLKTGTDIILSLGDETVNKNNRMLVRKDKNLSEEKLNKVFTYTGLFGRKNYSEEMLSKMLLQDIEQNFLYNSNMSAHEILKSINRFIEERFSEISNLYY